MGSNIRCARQYIFVSEDMEHTEAGKVVTHCDLDTWIFHNYVVSILDRLCVTGKEHDCLDPE